jgi:uncharacterized repeat protein (TIGR03803 family)
VTSSGGAHAAYGTVFRLAADGTETLLYSFTGGKDGGNPFATPLFDGLGNLYGTTAEGGSQKGGCAPSASGCGTIFSLPQK